MVTAHIYRKYFPRLYLHTRILLAHGESRGSSGSHQLAGKPSLFSLSSLWILLKSIKRPLHFQAETHFSIETKDTGHLLFFCSKQHEAILAEFTTSNHKNPSAVNAVRRCWEGGSHTVKADECSPRDKELPWARCPTTGPATSPLCCSLLVSPQHRWCQERGKEL